MEHDYFSALSKADLMRVVLALAGEVYVLADRQRMLEAELAGQGLNVAALDAPAEAAAYDEAAKARRDAFVNRVLAAISPHP